MNRAEFETAFRAALELAGVRPTRLRAYLLAKAAQECLVVDAKTPAGRVTDLALLHNNLFGINWNDGDERLGYRRVDLPGNVFDRAGGRLTVAYRVYDDWPHCVRNCMDQIFSSTHRDAAFRRFVLEAESTWAANPTHAEEVAARFDLYLPQEIRLRRPPPSPGPRVA